MRDDLIGRVIRALRHRKDWRQADLSAAAKVSRAVIADFEAGILDRHSIGALRSTASAAGGFLRLTVVVPQGDLDRLLDADHAQLQEHWKRWLERHGWEVEAEVTFNHYGERGSIDLLCFHRPTGVLLVIEIKTVVVDLQGMLSTIDRKVRMASFMAQERGWRVTACLPALLIREGSTARRRVTAHSSPVRQTEPSRAPCDELAGGSGDCVRANRHPCVHQIARCSSWRLKTGRSAACAAGPPAPTLGRPRQGRVGSPG